MSVKDDKEKKAADDEVEVCTFGVSVPFLMKFATTVDQNWSTWEVCKNVILPATEKTQKAYYELNPDVKDDDGNRMIGQANYFCSHAWKYKFVNVVNALGVFCKNNNLKPEETFIWFDLFINNQHMAPNLSYKWWCGRFKEAIRSFGKVVLVLEPWNDPIPITRAWCLWEIFCTIDTDSEFSITMCEEQLRDFKMKLVKDFNDILVALSKIDARRAEASKPQDRDKIFQAIRDAVGFAKLNERVIGKMREWLVYAGEEHLKKTTEEFGENHVQTLKTLNCLGKVQRDMNDYDTAVHLFRKALDRFTNETGKNSLLKGEIENNLAFSLQKQGKFPEAIEMHRKILRSRKHQYGELTKQTTQSMSNLATALRESGELAEARTLFKKAVKIRESIKEMGPNHPATLYTVSQYALTLSECKCFDEAEMLHHRAIEGMHKFFDKLVPNGRKHHLTLLAIHNMGHHLMLCGKPKKAMDMLYEAYHGRLEKLGESAKDTIETKQLLDKVNTKLNEVGMAPLPMDKQFSCRLIEKYMQGKDRRRVLWQKASVRLALIDTKENSI